MHGLAFLNPLLLWALPLAAVPIVIHLLNRRRFKRVPWAAMEFLLNAMKRNRKRLRMEQWLVLLLRTLAVLLLALLVARPQLAGGALLGARTHHVVMLDDTASMAQLLGSTNLFDRAQDRIRTLADSLAESRGGDLFSVVRTTRAAEPDLWALRIGADLGRRVGALVKEFPAGDGTMNLGETFREVRRRAGEVQEASFTRYYLVGDDRAHDWLTEDNKARAALQAELLAMPTDREHLEVLPVGGQDANNLAVTAVRRLDRLAVMGVPALLGVDITNLGLDPSQPTELAIEVDGKSRVVRPVDVVAPGERITVPVVHTFHSAGFHRVEAALPPTDRFLIDDRRTLALEVKDRARVLLVDGEPEDGGENAETFYIGAALDPGGEAVSGIEPQVVSDVALQEMDLQPFDAIWLCNVPAPVESLVAKLEAYVAAGGGLVVFAGSQVDPARYGEVLWKDGKGLLPLPYGELVGDVDRPERMTLVNRDHAIVARFPELVSMLMQRLLLVKRHLLMLEPPGATAAVLARVRDAEGSPAIAVRAFGTGGEVVQLAITADQQWTNWPKTDLNVVMSHQIHRHVVRVHDVSAHNLLTRGVYRLALDAGLYKPDVLVRGVGPDGEERTLTATMPEPPTAAPGTPPPPVPPGPAMLTLDLSMADLRELGAFEVELRGHGDLVEKRLFTRSLPLEESRLARANAAALQRAYPPEALERVTRREEGLGAGSGSGEGELWYVLAAALLVGLLVESLLAWRFGRR